MAMLDHKSDQKGRSIGLHTDLERANSILYAYIFAAWGYICNFVLVTFHAPDRLVQTNGLTTIWMLFFVVVATALDPIGDTRKDFCAVALIYAVGFVTCFMV